MFSYFLPQAPYLQQSRGWPSPVVPAAAIRGCPPASLRPERRTSPPHRALWFSDCRHLLRNGLARSARRAVGRRGDAAAEVDPWSILGVARGCTPVEVKKAYRLLARREHPDVSSRPDAASRWSAIRGAYDALGQPARRSPAQPPVGKSSRAERSPSSRFSSTEPSTRPRKFKVPSTVEGTEAGLRKFRQEDASLRQIVERAMQLVDSYRAAGDREGEIEAIKVVLEARERRRWVRSCLRILFDRMASLWCR
eukprot:TRINITY_DN42280_c0_g2_i1.p1 TRINITY_DN42280_c0_g2~~TRINITY_DN42280_c0_g2_i1.p1  ORF type:complete len:252 (-),score=32.74 TRINITY_DN42280_c0_g2_i1:578-1333(-)